MIIPTDTHALFGLNLADIARAVQEAKFVQRFWYGATDPKYTCTLDECNEILQYLAKEPFIIHTQAFPSKLQMATQLAEHLKTLSLSHSSIANNIGVLPSEFQIDVIGVLFDKESKICNALIDRMSSCCKPWWEELPTWGNIQAAAEDLQQRNFKSAYLVCGLLNMYNQQAETKLGEQFRDQLIQLEASCVSIGQRCHLMSTDKKQELVDAIGTIKQNIHTYTSMVLAIDKLIQIVNQPPSSGDVLNERLNKVRESSVDAFLYSYIDAAMGRPTAGPSAPQASTMQVASVVSVEAAAAATTETATATTETATPTATAAAEAAAVTATVTTAATATAATAAQPSPAVPPLVQSAGPAPEAESVALAPAPASTPSEPAPAAHSEGLAVDVAEAGGPPLGGLAPWLKGPNFNRGRGSRGGGRGGGPPPKRQKKSEEFAPRVSNIVYATLPWTSTEFAHPQRINFFTRLTSFIALRQISVPSHWLDFLLAPVRGEHWHISIGEANRLLLLAR